MVVIRRAALAVLASLLVALGMVAVPTAASAAPGDIGFEGASYGTATTPSADKPQSKLWFHDGRWWANMFDPTSTDWHIFYLDRAAQTWVDTGVAVDGRPTSSSDALWDGTYLYIGTHAVRTGSNASSTTAPMNLYRYTYNTTTDRFVPSSGFPKVISQNSSESLTIDRDSAGTVWATWTRVTGTTGTVMMNNGTGNGTTWGTPFTMPTTGGTNATVAVDDISTLVAFGGNRIGVLWSNQSTSTVYWSIHSDSAGRTTWNGGVAVQGSGMADDHLNIKSVQADTSGRVFAAVKTSLDTVSGADTRPQINLLSWSPSAGWGSTMFGRIRDCHTRPQVVLNGSNVYVFATGPTSTGTCTASGAGAIYMKSTSMASPSFTTGVGTIIMKDASSENLNNVTTTKQSASSVSGIVALASNDSMKRYWHADVVPGSGSGPTAPVASFTRSPASGTVPLTVAFTDTSTGSPTSWAWNFGDGGSATTQNPSHTYSSAGTYQVTLTATNAAGSSTSAAQTVTVNPGGGGGSGAVTAGSFTSASGATAGTAVTVPKPAGVVTGDVLVAQINADLNPDVSAAPAGWSTVIAPRSNGTGNRLFAYYKVVTNAAGEPGSYTWTLSAAVKWNAGIADFHGVDSGNPWDSAASGATGAAATSLTVPGVTTTTAGAMLIGGVGFNSTTATASPPSGWVELGEPTGGQNLEVAGQARPTAGATGNAVWTFNGSYSSTGWLRALRPGDAGEPGPTAPVASFTRSPASGTVPLTVAFTDTSTGSPTSWAWNFGDGGSATTQNPSHTYSTAGTYQVTLTATNAAGSSTSAAQTVTVNPGGGGGSGAVTAGSFTSASGATAGTAVTVPKPAGVVTGDVLVAQINADLNPDVSAAPAGWSTVIAPRSNGTGNRLFAYYKVVTNAAGEPGSYTWTLSAAVKWNAGIADFHGVDSGNPWDSAASGATGAAATSLTVPGVTTTTAGAMLIGGVGFNSTAATATPPSGWVELGEPTGGQNLEVAGQARPAAGVTGNAVWTFSGSYTSTGWLRALRPALS